MYTGKATLKRLLLAATLLAAAALSFALDFPHSPTANGISCPNCHDPDSAYTKLIKVANPHAPADIATRSSTTCAGAATTMWSRLSGNPTPA